MDLWVNCLLASSRIAAATQANAAARRWNPAGCSPACGGGTSAGKRTAKVAVQLAARTTTPAVVLIRCCLALGRRGADALRRRSASILRLRRSRAPPTLPLRQGSHHRPSPAEPEHSSTGIPFASLSGSSRHRSRGSWRRRPRLSCFASRQLSPPRLFSASGHAHTDAMPKLPSPGSLAAECAAAFG